MFILSLGLDCVSIIILLDKFLSRTHNLVNFRLILFPVISIY